MIDVSKTLVALMTIATHHDGVSAEMVEEISAQLEGATPLELRFVIAMFASMNDFTLSLLEEQTQLTRESFLQGLGQFFLENPEA